MAISRSLLILKLKALSVHLTISLVLVGIALALMLLQWFPPPLFTTDGGGLGLKLLILVDLVLGPVLTFIVFNPAKGKRQLTFDLGVIAVFQLAAFGYGLWNIHGVRVQTLAFHEGQFHSVTASRYAEQEIAADGWQRLGSDAPYMVNTREPETGEEGAGVAAYGFMSAIEPYELHFLYEPFAQTTAGYTLAELEAAQPRLAATARQWLVRKGLDGKSARFYRLTGFYDNAVLALDEQGRRLGGFAGELPPKPGIKPSSP
ncbi:MAG: hypothetical protein V4650_11600 [Pseudomonadota bacterium]